MEGERHTRIRGDIPARHNGPGASSWKPIARDLAELKQRTVGLWDDLRNIQGIDRNLGRVNYLCVSPPRRVLALLDLIVQSTSQTVGILAGVYSSLVLGEPIFVGIDGRRQHQLDPDQMVIPLSFLAVFVKC